MKRLILALTLALGCATTGAAPKPACVAIVTDATVKDAARRALDILISGASKDIIVANLEGLARDVGPDAFNCAMEYLKGAL